MITFCKDTSNKFNGHFIYLLCLQCLFSWCTHIYNAMALNNALFINIAPRKIYFYVYKLMYL